MVEPEDTRAFGVRVFQSGDERLLDQLRSEVHEGGTRRIHTDLQGPETEKPIEQCHREGWARRRDTVVRAPAAPAM